ncbi:perilipin-5-like isoform X2 [Dermacentor albipictus]|uniref:perilipin-5-like isoform X2 n=1 Tax=Dermacentor albipictus TaxID=60249 RepID=UPI0031FC61EB
MAAANPNRAAGDGAANQQLHLVERLASVPLVAGVFDVVSQRYAAIKARSPLLSAALSASENAAATAVGCCERVLRVALGPQLEHADALACRGIEKLEQRCPAVLRRPEEIAADVVAFGRRKVVQVRRCAHEQVERTRRVIGHAVHAATHPAAVVERVRDHVSQRLHPAFNEWISAHDPAHDVARNSLAVSHTFSELVFITLHKFRTAAALQFACERAAVEHILWAACGRFQRCLRKTPSRSQPAQTLIDHVIAASQHALLAFLLIAHTA